MTKQADTGSARDRFLDVLRSRHMMQPGEEWVIDANLNAHTREVTAAVLRVVAEQAERESDRQWLRDTAEDVEARRDDACCPLCQEVTCDTGCPMAAARTDRQP